MGSISKKNNAVPIQVDFILKLWMINQFKYVRINSKKSMTSSWEKKLMIPTCLELTRTTLPYHLLASLTPRPSLKSVSDSSNLPLYWYLIASSGQGKGIRKVRWNVAKLDIVRTIQNEQQNVRGKITEVNALNHSELNPVIQICQSFWTTVIQKLNNITHRWS